MPDLVPDLSHHPDDPLTQEPLMGKGGGGRNGKRGGQIKDGFFV